MIDKGYSHPTNVQEQLQVDLMTAQTALNVAQDHRFIKKRVRSMLGFKSFSAATSILAGVEAMHMIKKEQIDLQDQSVQNQKEFIHQLFKLTV